MSYILNFFVNKFRRAGHSTISLARPSVGDVSHDDGYAESAPLLAAEGGAAARSSRSSMQQHGDAHLHPNQTTAAMAMGLTDAWTDYNHSSIAMQHAILHLGMYLIVAVVGYSYIFEDWAISDSLYFATVVFTTVGYGDLSPSTELSRMFTVFFALYGIVILGIFLGIVGSFIIDRHEQAREESLKHARAKVMTQITTEHCPPEEGTSPSSSSSEKTLWQEMGEIIYLELPIVLVLVILAIPIIYAEGWSIPTGLYWMTITGTTVGFGDLDPTTTATKIGCIFYIPLAVSVLGEFLGRIASVYAERAAEEVEDRFMARSMNLCDLNVMDSDRDGKVSEVEFLTYMLVALQRVDLEDITELKAMFEKFDKSRTGFINKQDVIASLPGIDSPCD